MPLLQGTSEFRSAGPKLVPLLTTRWLYWRVHLSKVCPTIICFLNSSVSSIELLKTGNVCKLIFLFLLLFYMCNFVVVGTTKLHSNNYNNNSKNINLHTLNSAYNKKKYAEILLHYRWVFIKGNVFIGEWDIFGAGVFLHYSQFFIKGNFVIGRIECKCPTQFSRTNIGNVCRLVFFSCSCCFSCVILLQQVVVATPKLHSNNNNKKINLHKCPGQFYRTHIY